MDKKNCYNSMSQAYPQASRHESKIALGDHPCRAILHYLMYPLTLTFYDVSFQPSSSSLIRWHIGKDRRMEMVSDWKNDMLRQQIFKQTIGYFCSLDSTGFHYIIHYFPNELSQESSTKWDWRCNRFRFIFRGETKPSEHLFLVLWADQTYSLQVMPTKCLWEVLKRKSLVSWFFNCHDCACGFISIL